MSKPPVTALWAWSAVRITACSSQKASIPPASSTSSPKAASAAAIAAGWPSGPSRWEW